MKSLLRILLITAGASVFLFRNAVASPITFNTALPVSQNEFLFQETLLDRALDDGTAVVPGMEVTARGGVSILAYGVTGKLTLFGMLPYLDKTLDVTTLMGRIRRSNSGLGDSRFFARYTVYQDNQPGANFRVAPILGVVAPTGSDTYTDAYGVQPRAFQLGTGAWGKLAGVIMTYQTLNYEFDSSLTYQANGTHNGYSAGDIAELDASFQYRLLPVSLQGIQGVPHFLYAVIESNLIHIGRDVQNGSINSNSGGTEWLISPGIQYVTSRWVAEAAIQIPLQRNPYGNALRDKYILHAGVRFNF
ncbi:MAG TPA: transporter [Gammaproteobacteria bacterium]|nr:transporter [Gammaproteobacteria bacterium]